MQLLTFDEYRIRRAQLFLLKGIMKTAKFNTFEEFVKIDSYKQELEIDLNEYERDQAEAVLYG